VVNESSDLSESITNDMKAQAIAAKQYRLVPGQ